MSDELVEVHLIGLPVQIHHRASMHMRALQREFDLIRRRDSDTTSIPHRLIDLIAQLDEEFGGVGEQPVEALEDAVDSGVTTIDLVYRIPPSAGAASERLGELLDEADDYCRKGTHLLTVVTPDDALRYRRWFLSEFIRQTRGLPPVAWPDYRSENTAGVVAGGEDIGVTGGFGSLPSGWSVTHRQGEIIFSVSGSVDLVSGPSLRDSLTSLIAEHRRVVVDLESCDFMDSVGLSVLVAAHKRALEQQVDLRFRLSPAARQVIDLTGLADWLTLEH
jgi:anti-anti-sigma factor